MDGNPITRHYFTQQLQAPLSFCDLNLQNYHTHRIGAASTATDKGLQNYTSKLRVDGTLTHFENT